MRTVALTEVLKKYMKTLWAEFGLEIGSLPGLQNAHYLIAQNTKNSDPSDEVLQRVRIG